mgnify:CR=1 FL=1
MKERKVRRRRAKLADNSSAAQAVPEAADLTARLEADKADLAAWLVAGGPPPLAAASAHIATALRILAEEVQGEEDGK